MKIEIVRMGAGDRSPRVKSINFCCEDLSRVVMEESCCVDNQNLFTMNRGGSVFCYCPYCGKPVEVEEVEG